MTDADRGLGRLHGDAAAPGAPALKVVAAEQVRLVGLTIRREALVAGLLLLVPLVVTMIAQARVAVGGGAVGLDPGKEWGILAALVGALFPLAVWKAEEPFGESPLWQLPVGHRRHMVTKLAAGWLWLLVVLAAGLLILAVPVLLMGGTVGFEGTRLLLVDRAAAVAGAGLAETTREVAWSTPLWQWLVPFAGATVAYLLVSALVMGLRHPWKLLAAAAILALSVGIVSEEGNIEWLNRAWEAFFWHLLAHPLGLDMVATSGWDILTMRIGSADGGLRSVWLSLPSFGAWIAAAALWTGVALAAVAAAVARPRDH